MAAYWPSGGAATGTPESGLLTLNGKLRRDAVSARFASEIYAMYEEKKEREAVSRQHA